jgi:hypothetical protein
MAKRINTLGTVATWFHLVTFALFGVMIVISFTLAFSSWLSRVGRETPVSSRIGEAGIEFLYPHSAIALYTEGHAAPAAAIEDTPSSAGATTPLPSAGQSPTVSDVLAAESGSSSNSEPPLEAEAYPTIQHSRDAPPTRAVPIDKPLGASQESAPVSMPPSRLVSASPTASLPPVPAIQIPDEERDRLFEAFGIQHPPPDNLKQGAIASHQTMPAMDNRRPGEHPPGSKAAFQYRVRKECGPIRDAQLHRDCISSFGAHYR